MALDDSLRSIGQSSGRDGRNRTGNSSTSSRGGGYLGSSASAFHDSLLSTASHRSQHSSAASIIEHWKTSAQDSLENIDQVEGSLSQLIEETRANTKYGYVTPEWGFTAPNGLGGQLRGKFQPWEDKLRKCRDYFWPVERYEKVERFINNCASNNGVAVTWDEARQKLGLSAEGEQLFENAKLHEFLMVPPVPSVELDESDLHEYKSAAKIFILLGTLSHLCGNSGPNRQVPIPAWIEDPLRVVAKRLHVKPTLSGHFLVQENWTWRPMSCSGSLAASTDYHEHGGISNNLSSNNGGGSGMISSSTARPNVSDAFNLKDSARVVVRTLLEQCEIKDRRYRLTMYKNCFIGSQAVDVIVDNGFASTREEAVHIGRKINEAFRLFSHVTNDHLLKDQMLFFRFKKRWRLYGLDILTTTTPSSHFQPPPDDAGGGKRGQDDEEDDLAEENQPLIRLSLRSPSMLQHSGSLRVSKGESSTSSSAEPHVGAANETIGNIPDSSPSSSIGRQRSSGTSTSLKSFGGDNIDVDQHAGDDLRSADEAKVATYAAAAKELPTFRRQTSLEVALRQLNKGSLEEIAAAMSAMKSVAVKDRRYRLKIYKQCFIGSHLVDALMGRECAKSRSDAVRLARKINQRYHIFEHVCKDHHLKDEHLFFRFTDAFGKLTASGSDVSSLKYKLRQDSIDESISSKHGDANADGDVRLPTQTKSSDLESGSAISDSTLTSFNDLDLNLGCLEDVREFRFDHIDMLYPAFGNNHERVNQLIPACMGYALRSLPFAVIDILSSMRDILEAKLNILDTPVGSSKRQFYFEDEEDATRRLTDLLYQVAFSVSRCKEQFQKMSTDSSKRTFNSIHVSIRQTQPLSNGVLLSGGEKGKGTSGTHFPYFHLLDWLLGRYQNAENGGDGLVAKLSAVDACFPRPQREYIRRLSKLHSGSTLRGFIDLIGRPQEVMVAYNRLIECYAGEGGVLTAHCRKLYSYMHNDVQSSTSGTNHAGITGSEDHAGEDRPLSVAEKNHSFAMMMFRAMRSAAEERWRLRVGPLMTEVEKLVYSTSESGGFTTVALNLDNKGLRYEYGDVVRVLLPNDDKTTISWVKSLSSSSDGSSQFLKLSDLPPGDGGIGWGWSQLWEALGWSNDDQDGIGEGVPLEMIARYIEQAQIRDVDGKSRWVNSSLDLCSDEEERLFAAPPPIPIERIACLVPVSPRIYSVSGVESDRVFLLVSKPLDGARHHGYERMADPRVETVHCSFAPSTFFLVPPVGTNLVCVASGTGISPFVGLADVIGPRRGMYTIAHQCKSSDLFLSNSQTWLDFTALNPGAVVFGYISGDRSRRNCPMRYVIRNGMFDETAVLGRHNSSAYYFQCDRFQERLHEVYQRGGLNLAYCCGGVLSAIDPLKEVMADNGWKYEFTVESYAGMNTLTKKDFSCQIGGTIVNLDGISPIHEGGDAILRKVHQVAMEGKRKCPKAPVDLSDAFWQLHPHAYNLLRCLRTPLDADFEAFAEFLRRQNASRSVIAVSATKYAQAALTSPDNSKVVRIASELQSTAIAQQISAGDVEGAKKSAEYLEALLEHVPNEEANARRWNQSLLQFNSSFQDG